MLTKFINSIYEGYTITNRKTDGLIDDSDVDSRNSDKITLNFVPIKFPKDLTLENDSTPEIFKYFQDGSEMLIFPLSIYKDRKDIPYPIAIGQISSVIVSRDADQYNIKEAKYKTIIFLPKLQQFLKEDDGLSKDLTDDIDKNQNLSEDIKNFFKNAKIKTYTAERQKNQSKYKDEIYKLLSEERTELEKELLKTIQQSQDNKWLIRDGSLVYDIDSIDFFHENTLWVSKRWPMPNENTIYTLKDFQRTKIFKATHEIKEKTYNIYRWYMRPRKQFDKRAFDSNIIMCEIRKIGTDKKVDDIEIETEINELCKSLIYHETYPTCFEQDYRWERHLYGVHVAEKVCKSILHSKKVIFNLPLYNEQ